MIITRLIITNCPMSAVNRRKGIYILVLFIILSFNFLLPRLMPGDPFLFLSVEDGNVSAVFSEEQIRQYRGYYGLDQPLAIQFGRYLVNLLHGNLGHSIYFGQSVTAMILSRLPWTLGIAGIALLLSSCLGVLLGTISAVNRSRLPDRVLYPSMVFINEIPPFLLGILLLFFFGARLRWFPLSGGTSAFAVYPSAFSRAADIFRHGVLPVLALTLSRVGGFYLIARGSLLTILSKDYIRTARGKGLSRNRILIWHALRNALPPILSRVFMSFGAIIGNTILVENVFAYPGLGRLMREAVLNRDYVLIQGIFLVMAIIVLLMNRLSDKVSAKLDARITYL